MIKSNVLASAKGELYFSYSHDNTTDSNYSTGKIVSAKYDSYIFERRDLSYGYTSLPCVGWQWFGELLET